mmetsp:Transcript_18434/g.33206  ORF Transcript_18434/g.33206 Transcript_18434/m.33206 type:complete len:321 (-) Transcript_18434:1075-2037(-)
MSKRSTKYVEAGAADDFAFNEEVALAIIRRLQIHEVCSFDWLQVAKDIGQLAEFSDNELARNPETAYDISERLGRGAKDTLWDSTTCSTIPKCIVDENKVSLILTLAKQFKEWQQVDHFEIRVRQIAQGLQIQVDALHLDLNLFETSISKLLGRVFSFVEGLQQTNQQILCQHIVSVVRKLVSHPAIYDENLQEGQVFNYISAIFDNASQLSSEELLMEWLEHRSLFPAIINYIITQQGNLQRPFLIKILRALATAAETDIFVDNFSNYFVDTAQKQAFIAFRMSFIRDLIVEDPSIRKSFRALLECTDKLEREQRFKRS